MSDDGYFYDEEIDDFEGDLFWNDDGEIVLADDLAEHTLPSPAYVEDPAYENMDGYSDWEYYSDDYYDDDPTLLKNNPQEGSPLQRKQPKRIHGPHRGKKGKLAATSDIPDLSLNEDVKDDLKDMGPCFKGIIWRSSPAEKKEKKLYEPGIGERVALLGNWREVFRASQPFGEKRRKSPFTARKPRDNSNEATVIAPSIETSLSQSVALNGSREVLHLDEEKLATPRNRKRRRISFAKSPLSPPNHKVIVEIPVHRVNGVNKDGPENQKESAQKRPSSRKRKANDVENESTNGSISKPPAKRVASGRASVGTREKKKPPPVPIARSARSARSTRSKKK